MQDQRTAALFSIRWDGNWGGYRVSVPNLDPSGEGVDVARVDSLSVKLDEMELHDDLPDSFDLGYMAAWREFRDFLGLPDHQ